MKISNMIKSYTGILDNLPTCMFVNFAIYLKDCSVTKNQINHFLTFPTYLCKIYGEQVYQYPSTIRPTVACMYSYSIFFLKHAKQLVVGGRWNSLVALRNNFWELHWKSFQTCLLYLKVEVRPVFTRAQTFFLKFCVQIHNKMFFGLCKFYKKLTLNTCQWFGF